MKKFLASIAAATAVALSMSTVAFAADNFGGDDTTSTDGFVSNIPVAIDVVGDENAQIVYGVDVDWEDLTFTYEFNEDTAGTWKPSDHTMSGGETEDVGEWTKDTGTITVTNHSNADISIATEYTADNNNEINSKITVDVPTDVTVSSAVGTEVENAPSVDLTVTVDGTPANATANDLVIGTIELTISAAE